MGLDSVELVMDVEDRFGIRLADHECSRVRTVADLAALVIARLPRGTEVCPSAQAFYRVRRLLLWHKPLARSAIRPSTRLEEAGLADDRDLWARLRKAEPAMPLRVLPRWAETTASSLMLGSVVLVAAIFVVFASFVDFMTAVSFTIVTVFVVIPVHLWIVNPILNRFSVVPAHIATVGDLAKRVMSPVLPGETSGQRLIAQLDVLRTVREITAEQVGKPLDEIRPETDFVKDLGF